MLPGMELMGCQDLAVPNEVMRHVVNVESAFNPYAIGVVAGRLERQPRSASEALATARDLDARGYNFSLGLAQVNRHNLKKYGLASYEMAFQACPNLQAGARILAECHARSGGDWGKSFSCYYSGNFVTGFRHGYVQKVFASMRGASAGTATAPPVRVAAGSIANGQVPRPDRRLAVPQRLPAMSRVTEAAPSKEQPVVLLAPRTNARDMYAASTGPVSGSRPSTEPDPALPAADTAFVF